MNVIWQTITASDFAHRLGWALLHSLWLGTVTAALLALVNKVLPRRSARVRYLAACMALVATAGLSASAFFLMPARAKPASTNLQSHDAAQHVISTVAAAPRVSEAAVTSASSMANAAPSSASTSRRLDFREQISQRVE